MGAHNIEQSDEQHVHQGQTEQTEVHAVLESLLVEHHAAQEICWHPNQEEEGSCIAKEDIFNQQVGFVADDVVRVVPG